MDSYGSSSVSGTRGERRTPFCECGERAVLRSAKTAANYGRKFWGCRNYHREGLDIGCGFFEWHVEDVVDEKDMMLMRQRRRIINLQKSVNSSRRWVKLLTLFSLISVVLNFVLIYKVWG